MLSILSCVYQPSVCLLWRNVCLGLLPIFWLGCLLFLCWAIWTVILCQLFQFSIFFSYPEGFLLILFIVSFAVQKLLSLIRMKLEPFAYFYFHYCRRCVKEDLAVIYVKDIMFLLMFSFKSFIVSGLTFKYIIHFEFISVYGIMKCYSFVLLHVAI